MKLSVCVTDDDYEAWRSVRIGVLPSERCNTVAELPLPAGIDVVTLGEYPELWADCFETFGKEALADFALHTPLEWAAANGLRELYTWTQIGNSAMRGLNERLGYVTSRAGVTVSRALPLVS